MTVRGTENSSADLPLRPGHRFKSSGLEISWLRRIGWSSGWLLLARVVTQLQLAIFTLLVARRLGVVAFGQYAFITAVVVVGNVLTTFGTDTLLIREISRTRHPDDRRIFAALLLQIGLSVFFIGLVFLWTVIIPQEDPTTLLGLRLYSLTLLPLAFFSIFTALLRAWERMDLYLLAAIFSAFLQLGGVWFLVNGSNSLLPLIYFLIAVQIFLAIFAGILCWAAIPRFMPSQLHVERATLVLVWTAAWPFALLSILGVVYQRLGVLGLSLLAGDAPAGWFSVASRMVEALKIVHIAVLGAVFPVLSNRASLVIGEGENKKIFPIIFWGLASFSFVVASTITFFAQPLVSILFGQAYFPAANLLRLMVWSLLPYTVSSCCSIWLVLSHREKTALAGTAIGFAVALSLNVWLIPVLGIFGAGMASILGECVLAGVLLSLNQRTSKV